MKKLSNLLVPMLALAVLLISACTGAPISSDSAGGSKVQAAPVQFTGVIESINGNQWVVGGQTITVDPSVVGDGPFVVGDTVKVEVQVQSDGSMVVTRVESPTAGDNSNESNSNDVNTNDANGNATNSNDNGGLTLDNNNAEAFGTVDSITADSIIIGGQTFTIASGAEFLNQIQAGDFVKVHFLLNADGTMSITQIETFDPALVTNDNSNSNTSLDDNGNNSNSNGVNSNDDNGNDSNSNSDDHNDNSAGDNDDNGNDSNDNNSNGNSSNGNGG